MTSTGGHSGAQIADLLSAIGRCEPAEVDAVMQALADWVTEQPPRSALTHLAEWRSLLDYTESRVIGGRPGDPTAPGNTLRLADEQNISRREARKRAERAEVLANNQVLSEQLATGKITAEHVDAVAEAARKSDGEATTDADLIEHICDSNPDQAKKAADHWLAERMRAADAEARYRQQRAARNIRFHKTKDGMPALTMQGDQASIDLLRDRVGELANAMYRLDGGRDIASGDHERTHRQRMFDAVVDLLTGDASTGSDNGPSSRSVVVATVTVDKLLGDDSEALAQIIGGGPIPDNILAEYLCRSDLVGMVLSASGEPLWLGRRVRYASKAQVLALIQRDRACVLCSAPHQQCEAHHLMPWNAPGEGDTDVDALALVCPACHHHIHANDLTLYRDGECGRWKTRPATVHERAPVHRPSNTPSRAGPGAAQSGRNRVKAPPGGREPMARPTQKRKPQNA